MMMGSTVSLCSQNPQMLIISVSALFGYIEGIWILINPSNHDAFFFFILPHQTGSGKTYTMGTACKEGSRIGIIPRAMAALFDKIENLKSQVEFQLRVSFIEVQELFHIIACE